jgi:hypothetical protein
MCGFSNNWPIVGFLAYYVVMMCHEVLGHGVAFYMLGAHHFVLTSTSIDSSDTLAAFAPGTLGYRFICAAGSLSAILLGILLYPLLILALRKQANITIRIFSLAASRRGHLPWFLPHHLFRARVRG